MDAIGRLPLLMLLDWNEKGRFVKRNNRFSVLVNVNGEEKSAYLPNPGRLEELLVPGAGVLLRRAHKKRKTEFDLVAVRCGRTLVSIDSRVPNTLFEEAFKSGKLAEFSEYSEIRGEIKSGSSRIDFILDDKCLVEVKSCTLVELGLALFPDAPTERGRRHLYELLDFTRRGGRSAVVFIIQREDAEIFSPNYATDMAFSRALEEVAERGVEVYAYKCRVSRKEIELHKRVEVAL